MKSVEPYTPFSLSFENSNNKPLKEWEQQQQQSQYHNLFECCWIPIKMKGKSSLQTIYYNLIHFTFTRTDNMINNVWLKQLMLCWPNIDQMWNYSKMNRFPRVVFVLYFGNVQIGYVGVYEAISLKLKHIK